MPCSLPQQAEKIIAASTRQGATRRIPSLAAMADAKFKANFLAKHNECRKKHGVPAVTISQDLCSSAQAWADHLLSTKALQHSKTNNGENLYYFRSSAPKALTGEEPVDSWYSEIKDYNFSKPGFQSNTGHFTQVVWKATTEIGVGLATDGKTVFVVGQYKPAGNISNPGYFQDNVLPAGGKRNRQPPGGIEKSQAMADESFKAKFLDKHNEYRKKHGVPPVTFSQDLCTTAQTWADHMLSIKTLKHSDTNDGENVYYCQSSVKTALVGEEPVTDWYNEIKDYDFSKPGDQPGTGHFTQVVWKATTEIGVGLATDGHTSFVVGQYKPAGNIINPGYYEENVLPAAEDGE
ncbi:protein PRY1-like [Silurus meridionalis]|uniref:protein PRY1-like n=1 Tax=Silurus meridionalis TaxID=175797 RepID=UPI001EEC46DA|nr:protein PRY1-like [Silurus meridionalis]